jgi:hypothetical protein|tara:strand:- start:248 stop:841 length:594 start_codon:yes stop_codon:yes gene_type:complete
MALTGLTEVQFTNLNVTGVATFAQTVGIAGTLTYEDVTNIDSVGMITARSGVKVNGGQVSVGAGTSLHSTGLDLGTGNITGHNLKSSGIITATSFVGTGVSVVGVITATSLVGDGSDITGISGFATALSSTPNTLLNECFKTTEAFTIGAGTSIKIESDNTSGNTAFTRLSRINVSTGATFHVSSGTTFIMNVLNVF